MRGRIPRREYRELSICIVGNSHARTLERFAAGRSGIKFLSAPGTMISRLKFSGEKVVVPDEELATYVGVDAGSEIDISIHSAVVLYGCQLVSAGKGNGWLNFCNSSPRYSSSCMQQAFEDRTKSTIGYELTRCLLGSHSNVWVVPSPFPNRLHPLVDRQAKWTELVEKLRLRFIEIFASLGAHALWVPDSLTDESGYAVRDCYKLDREGDNSHLNREGSALMMKHINAHVNT